MHIFSENKLEVLQLISLRDDGMDDAAATNTVAEVHRGTKHHGKIHDSSEIF